MSETNNIKSFQQTFECFRFDSAACDSRLFPIPPQRHYFSEVILVRSGICHVVRGNCTHTLHSRELLYVSPLVQVSIDSADGNPVVFDIVRFSATRLKEIPSYMTDMRCLALDAAHANLPVYMNTEEVK